MITLELSQTDFMNRMYHPLYQIISTYVQNLKKENQVLLLQSNRCIGYFTYLRTPNKFCKVIKKQFYKIMIPRTIFGQSTQDNYPRVKDLLNDAMAAVSNHIVIVISLYDVSSSYSILKDLGLKFLIRYAGIVGSNMMLRSLRSLNCFTRLTLGGRGSNNTSQVVRIVENHRLTVVEQLLYNH